MLVRCTNQNILFTRGFKLTLCLSILLCHHWIRPLHVKNCPQKTTEGSPVCWANLWYTPPHSSGTVLIQSEQKGWQTHSGPSHPAHSSSLWTLTSSTLVITLDPSHPAHSSSLWTPHIQHTRHHSGPLTSSTLVITLDPSHPAHSSSLWTLTSSTLVINLDPSHPAHSSSLWTLTSSTLVITLDPSHPAHSSSLWTPHIQHTRHHSGPLTSSTLVITLDPSHPAHSSSLWTPHIQHTRHHSGPLTSSTLVITLDPSHPAHSLFELLPSGRRYRALSTRTTRHRNSFFPQAIQLMNTWQ